MIYFSCLIHLVGSDNINNKLQLYTVMTVAFFRWEGDSLLLGDDFKKSPAACTPGSAAGPTLDNEYGRTLPSYGNDECIYEVHNKLLSYALIE